MKNREKIEQIAYDFTSCEGDRKKLQAEILALFAVVQVKPEVCQCYDDDIGMYLKGIEYYCASCDLPIKAN